MNNTAISPKTALRIRTLREQAHNMSNKPMARLKASMAGIELAVVMKSLPGSIRRGIERGHIAI